MQTLLEVQSEIDFTFIFSSLRDYKGTGPNQYVQYLNPHCNDRYSLSTTWMLNSAKCTLPTKVCGLIVSTSNSTNNVECWNKLEIVSSGWQLWCIIQIIINFQLSELVIELQKLLEVKSEDFV